MRLAPLSANHIDAAATTAPAAPAVEHVATAAATLASSDGYPLDSDSWVGIFFPGGSTEWTPRGEVQVPPGGHVDFAGGNYRIVPPGGSVDFAGGKYRVYPQGGGVDFNGGRYTVRIPAGTDPFTAFVVSGQNV